MRHRDWREVLGRARLAEQAVETETLPCPICGRDHLHLEDAQFHDAGDEYDPSNPLRCRGPWASLTLWCETCRHRSQIVVAFHKGQVRVGTVWAVGTHS
jgi:hypothetical protein